MSDSDAKSPEALRREAEARLSMQEPAVGTAPDIDPSRLLHEFQLHQVELEIQNEKLRRVQRELEVSRSRFFELYDRAPVAYCTLNETGLILQGNLAAATLLESSREELVAEPIRRFIVAEAVFNLNVERRV
jgi:PAS domain-containing protein